MSLNKKKPIFLLQFQISVSKCQYPSPEGVPKEKKMKRNVSNIPKAKKFNSPPSRPQLTNFWSPISKKLKSRRL